MRVFYCLATHQTMHEPGAGIIRVTGDGIRHCGRHSIDTSLLDGYKATAKALHNRHVRWATNGIRSNLLDMLASAGGTRTARSHRQFRHQSAPVLLATATLSSMFCRLKDLCRIKKRNDRYLHSTSWPQSASPITPAPVFDPDPINKLRRRPPIRGLRDMLVATEAAIT